MKLEMMRFEDEYEILISRGGRYARVVKDKERGSRWNSLRRIMDIKGRNKGRGCLVTV